eukprot:770866_1
MSNQATPVDIEPPVPNDDTKFEPKSQDQNKDSKGVANVVTNSTPVNTTKSESDGAEEKSTAGVSVEPSGDGINSEDQSYVVGQETDGADKSHADVKVSDGAVKLPPAGQVSEDADQPQTDNPDARTADKNIDVEKGGVDNSTPVDDTEAAEGVYVPPEGDVHAEGDTIATEAKSESAISEKSADKELVAKEPANKEPVVKEPADKEPVVKEPADKEHVVNETADKEHVIKEPPVKQPTDKEPAGKESVDKEPTGESATEPLPEESGEVDREPETVSYEDFYERNRDAMLEDALAEQDHTLQENRRLLQKVLSILESQDQGQVAEVISGISTSGLPQTVETVSNRYHKKLKEVSDAQHDFNSRQNDVNYRILHLSTRLEEEDRKARELRVAFKEFKREIARTAMFTRTGRPIQQRRILYLESEEETRDKQLESARLKNIHYGMQLKKMEKQVREKEQLAEGLHLIDFEQLKIENQTLNEKIEERNDELHKLRKKTTTTVQVLTHIKEKLQFVIAENGSFTRSLTLIESEVASLRDELTRKKRVRDKVRRENSFLKEKQGFVGSDLLMVDFEDRKEKLRKLEDHFEYLKDHHRKLSRTIEKGDLAQTTMT